MKPIIRWAGSKRLLVPALAALAPFTFKRYIEPFCGSACLFFHLEPKEAILGDLNGDLIETYRALKNDADLVSQCLRRLPQGERGYYRVRAMDPTGLAAAEVAARFLYLNRNCFNGIYRTNRNGNFNVPYGPPKSGRPLDLASLWPSVQILKRAAVLNADFESTLQLAEAGDFVYLDPPFAVARRRIFAEYHHASFALEDIARLASCLSDLDARGVKFLVSYADSAEARALLKDWHPRRVVTRRHVAGFAGDRRRAYELVARNFEGANAN